MDILRQATEDLERQQAEIDAERTRIEALHAEAVAMAASVKAREEAVEVREVTTAAREEAQRRQGAALADREADLLREIEAVPEECLRGVSVVVEVNVGGTIFVANRTTLTAYPDSMLAAMFSGRHELAKDKDDRIFLDCSPAAFEVVLDWLRDYPEASVPRLDKTMHGKVRALAEYFLLTALEEALSVPHAVYVRGLEAMMAKEAWGDSLRKAAAGTLTGVGRDQAQHLLPLLEDFEITVEGSDEELIAAFETALDALDFLALHGFEETTLGAGSTARSNRDGLLQQAANLFLSEQQQALEVCECDPSNARRNGWIRNANQGYYCERCQAYTGDFETLYCANCEGPVICDRCGLPAIRDGEVDFRDVKLFVR